HGARNDLRYRHVGANRRRDAVEQAQARLTAQQRLFRLLVFGDVLRRADHPRETPRVVHDGLAAPVHDAHRAVGPHGAVIEVKWLMIAERLPDHFTYLLAVIRMDAI